MELKKTTILSAFVVIAGLIAEIIFRDVLSRSISGIVISLVLAVIIVVSFYFTIEGVYFFWNSEREKEKKHQKEVEQRLYNILNEQLKFQKIIYNEVHRFVQSGGAESPDREAVSAVSQPVISQEVLLSDNDLEKIISAVNAHTSKVTKDIEDMVLEMSEQTTRVTKEIEQMVSDKDGQPDIANENVAIERVMEAIENMAEKQNQSVDNVTALLNGQSSEVENIATMVREQQAEMENVAETLSGQSAELGNIAEVVNGQSAELGNIAEVVNGQSAELGNVAETLNGQSAELGNVTETLNGQGAELRNVTEAMGGHETRLENLLEMLRGQSTELGSLTAMLEGQAAEREEGPLEAEQPDFSALVSEINDYTMNTAKVVARYIGKTSGELEKKVEEHHEQILHAIGS